MSKNKSKTKSTDNTEKDIKELFSEWLNLGEAHNIAMEKVSEIQAEQDKIVQILHKKLKTLDSADINFNLMTDSTDQSEIIVDKTVKNYNTIKLVDSLYEGKFKISSMGSTTFSFNVPYEPESAEYTNITSKLSYNTSSSGALGPIADIKVTNMGIGYRSIPGISTVKRNYTGTAATTYGDGCILRVESDSIGKVKTTEIINPGYEFPYDQTLRPTGALPSLFKVDRFRTLDHIGLSSGGHNYSTPPKLIVKDRVSDQVLTEMEITTEVSGSVGVSSIIIVENTKRLQDPYPSIIPIHNSNGVGIQTVGFTTSNATVELT